MPEWIITSVQQANAGNLPDGVEAEYFKITENGQFIEFKDADHKVVYVISAEHIVSIKRAEPKTGQNITVNVHGHGSPESIVGHLTGSAAWQSARDA